MDKQIAPALTPEEWAEAFARGLRRPALHKTRNEPLSAGVSWDGELLIDHEDEDRAVSIAPQDAPAIAALALQGAGPDGGPLFTWEHVDALWSASIDLRSRARADKLEASTGGLSGEDEEVFQIGWATEMVAVADRLDWLAALIASLLPPRPTAPESEE